MLQTHFANSFFESGFKQNPPYPPGITDVEGKGEIDAEKELVSDDVRITDVEEEFASDDVGMTDVEEEFASDDVGMTDVKKEFV